MLRVKVGLVVMLSMQHLLRYFNVLRLQRLCLSLFPLSCFSKMAHRNEASFAYIMRIQGSNVRQISKNPCNFSYYLGLKSIFCNYLFSRTIKLNRVENFALFLAL